MQALNGNTYAISVLSPTTFALLEYTNNNFTNPRNFIGVDTRNLGAFTSAPLVRIVDEGVVSYIPGQKAQTIPSAELNKFLTSAADVIGPNNPMNT